LAIKSCSVLSVYMRMKWIHLTPLFSLSVDVVQMNLWSIYTMPACILASLENQLGAIWHCKCQFSLINLSSIKIWLVMNQRAGNRDDQNTSMLMCDTDRDVQIKMRKRADWRTQSCIVQICSKLLNNWASRNDTQYAVSVINMQIYRSHLSHVLRQRRFFLARISINPAALCHV